MPDDAEIIKASIAELTEFRRQHPSEWAKRPELEEELVRRIKRLVDWET